MPTLWRDIATLSSQARSTPNEAPVAMIKEIIILAALAVSSPTVIDGDTVRIAGVSVRLTDYDAPELFSPKCPQEYTRAAAAVRLNGRSRRLFVPCSTMAISAFRCQRGDLDKL